MRLRMARNLWLIQRTLPSLASCLNGASRNFAMLGGGEVWRSPVADMQNPFEREKVKCILCQYNIVPNYKNFKLLSQFVSPYTGRIYGRHITRLCAKQQARLEKEIMKSQSAGFMPYYFKDVSFLKDPKLFDPDKPIRPHRF
ncbi:28S ribosomal protein S18c [Blattella germanica]|nr:28S ribosomal protein S18c [Blattella germanica]